MPDFDVAGIMPTVQKNALATQTQARAQQQKAQQMAVVTGQPTFWGRIGQVGIGQVNLLNAEKLVKSTAVSTAEGLKGAATGIARTLPGGQNDLKAEANQTTSANNATKNIIQLQKSGKINKGQASKLLTQSAENASEGAKTVTKTVKSEPTPKEFAGDIAETALLAVPGASGAKAVATGADLLKTFGTQGVKDLADKAGVDVAGKASLESAEQVAKTKVAQQAFRKATTSVVKNAVKSSVKGAAGFGAFGAAGEAGQGGSNKQIIKAGEQGAAVGAVAGAAGSLVKSGVKAASGKTPKIEKGTAPKEEVTKSPVTTLGKPKEAKISELGGNRTQNETQIALEKAHNSGDTTTEGIAAAKLKDPALAGKSTVPPGAAKLFMDAQKAGKPITMDEARAKAKGGLGEEGSVNPGQAVKDVKDLVAKHQATTKYSGDIQRGGDEVEGTKKQIASDAIKVAKAQPKLSVFDKHAIQDYRDAKEAGLPTPELPGRLKAANDDITELNKAATAAKSEQARLEGRESDETGNPETYTHREAQGKGTMFDRLLQGSKQRIPSGTSFGKRISSDKGRVFQAITDSRGNRRVVAVKNESFGKIKHLTGFEGADRPINLGKHSYDADTNTLTNAKGEKLKLGQATTSEITKQTGQKYYTDPQLTSLKNYVDSRTALENVKYIESIKNHPDFENFASAPDKTAPKGWKPVHGLFQFQGYKFEPKTAEALRDIVKNSSDETDLSDKVGNLLKKTIVYFPLKHNLNQTATYAVDRGLSSLVNPMAYKRGAVSLVRAFHEVTNEGPIFQKLQKAGFSLPSTDDKAFTNYVIKELKGVSKDDPRVVEMAKSFGTSPAKLYNAISHTAVWQYGDILNVARVMERMAPKTFSKGMDFDEAMKATEKYSLQYKVPSRVGPTKLGRSVSRTFQSPKIFFGRYRYDLYKIMGNTIKDTVNLKTLAQGGKENAQAVDKLAAMAFGAALVWPLVDKGLQKLTGNPNANTTAPGALQIPELINKVRTGKESPETAVGNQAYVSGAITVPLELQANRDSFTGNNIYDPNASAKQKLEQVGTWLKNQTSFGQKAGSAGNGSNKSVDVILGIAGTNLPKNSTGVSKLYSLQYDSLPDVQTKAKSEAKSGNFTAAQSTIDSYDKQVLQAAKDALKASKTPVPSDNILIAKLKKSGTYYAPKPKTIQSWKTKTPSNAKTLLGL